MYPQTCYVVHRYMHILQEKLLKLADEHDLGHLTLRQISELLGDRSLHPQQIKHHLTQLQKKKLLRIDRDKGVIARVRSSAISKGDFLSIPILGAANCGEPLQVADEHIEGYLRLSRSMLKKKKDVYALRAVGSSMNQAKVNGSQSIDDGDYVIVDGSDKEPVTNTYVVSIIDGMANIKKILVHKEDGTLFLVSESTKHFPPIYIHSNDFSDYMISGKVIQVIKQPT